MKRKTLLGLIGLCLWLADGVARAQGTDLAHFQAMNLTRVTEVVPLPDVSLSNLAGKSVSLQSFRGKLVLLNFWATW